MAIPPILINFPASDKEEFLKIVLSMCPEDFIIFKAQS